MSKQNKKIIRGLHRKDLTNIKYASALLDMAISEKDDDLKFAGSKEFWEKFLMSVTISHIAQ